MTTSDRQQKVPNHLDNGAGMAILTIKKTSVESYSIVFENQGFLSILIERNESSLKNS
jgi:hypothetical protein